MSHSLQSHVLQQARLLCPPLSPGVCSISGPLSQGCNPNILSSLPPSPLALSLSYHQSLYQRVNPLHQVVRFLELSLSISPFNEYLG